MKIVTIPCSARCFSATGRLTPLCAQIPLSEVMLVILAPKFWYMPQRKPVVRFSEPQSIIPDYCFNGPTCLI